LTAKSRIRSKKKKIKEGESRVHSRLSYTSEDRKEEQERKTQISMGDEGRKGFRAIK